MELKGVAHCFFEQSGTFKNEFIKLGIHAFDYDIQDNFGQTDHVVDLFREIESAWEGQKSVFDSISKEDLILAFFPCIYLCSMSQVSMFWDNVNYRGLPYEERTRQVLERAENRLRFFSLAIKMLTVAKTRGLRLVMENPWTTSYLNNNFILPPSVVDNNRSLRGDFFVKPTAYWFINCAPEHSLTNPEGQESETRVGLQERPTRGPVLRRPLDDFLGLCPEFHPRLHPRQGATRYAARFV